MKPLKNTPVGKFLTEHKLESLLLVVADMPPSLPLLSWLEELVRLDDNVNAENKKKFTRLCDDLKESIEKRVADRPPVKSKTRSRLRQLGLASLGFLELL